jgi:hypothetical protein
MTNVSLDENDLLPVPNVPTDCGTALVLKYDGSVEVE